MNRYAWFCFCRIAGSAEGTDLEVSNRTTEVDLAPFWLGMDCNNVNCARKSLISFSKDTVSVCSPTEWFTRALFTMAEARDAKRNVLIVSSKLLSAGDTQANITVMPLPPSASFNRRVSLDSR